MYFLNFYVLPCGRKMLIPQRLADNDDEDVDYLNAEWADGHSLKRQFQGLKNISWNAK